MIYYVFSIIEWWAFWNFCHLSHIWIRILNYLKYDQSITCHLNEVNKKVPIGPFFPRTYIFHQFKRQGTDEKTHFCITFSMTVSVYYHRNILFHSHITVHYKLSSFSSFFTLCLTLGISSSNIAYKYNGNYWGQIEKTKRGKRTCAPVALCRLLSHSEIDLTIGTILVINIMDKNFYERYFVYLVSARIIFVRKERKKFISSSNRTTDDTVRYKRGGCKK